MRTQLSPSLAIKLASMVVHVEELDSPKGHEIDKAALRGLVQDAEVRKWVASFDPVLLPVKR